MGFQLKRASVRKQDKCKDQPRAGGKGKIRGLWGKVRDKNPCLWIAGSLFTIWVIREVPKVSERSYISFVPDAVHASCLTGKYIASSSLFKTSNAWSYYETPFFHKLQADPKIFIFKLWCWACSEDSFQRLYTIRQSSLIPPQTCIFKGLQVICMHMTVWETVVYIVEFGVYLAFKTPMWTSFITAQVWK